MIVRKDSWAENLSKYLSKRQFMPFAWGAHDCCAFACGAAEAQCGVDPMKGIYGKYKTAKGALLYLKRNGGDLPTFAKQLGKKNGLTEIPPLMAGRGCIVMAKVDTPEGKMPALGIVGLDSRFALFVSIGDGGWFELPVSECFLAWSFD